MITVKVVILLDTGFMFVHSAIATVVIDPGINGVGVGWMFTILGLIMTAANVMLVVLRIYGPRWRKARMQKQDQSLKH